MVAGAGLSALKHEITHHEDLAVDRLCQAICDLIGQLTSNPAAPQSVEAKCLRHLQGLLKAAEIRNSPLMESLMADFRNFWLQSVPWCSALSKEIERVLVLYDETLHL